MNYDPMTGQPINDAPKFDPMTGEPINAASAETPVGSAPQPSAPDMQANAQPRDFTPNNTGFAPDNAGFAPSAPQPPKKSNSLLKGIGIAAVVAALAGGAFYYFNQNFINNASLAVKVQNTFKSDHLLQCFDINDISASNKQTIEVKANVDGSDYSAQWAIDSDAKKQSLELSGQVKSTTISGLVTLDEKELKINVPSIMKDDYFFYDYTKNNDGEFIEQLEYNYDVDQQTFNSGLSSIVNSKADTQLYADLSKATYDTINAIKFDNIEKKSFTMDGKEVQCPGKHVTFDKDLYLMFIDNYGKVFEAHKDQLDPIFKQYSDTSYSSAPESVEEMLEKAKEDADDIKPVDINIYTYKNRVAAFEMVKEDDKDRLLIEFRGGATPTENIAILDKDDKVVFEKKGTTEGSVEKCEYYFDGNKSFDTEYDFNSGAVKVSSDDFSLNGSLKKSSGNLLVQIDELKANGEKLPVNGSIEFKNSAEVKEMPSGEKYDIGTMNSDDLMELYDKWDLSSLYSMMY